ncbi:hypothetical protein SteCoe_16697 [Stentor coeruleus]|uniref:Uncharacterized protein n=1 Tax=Stentor coeruleus TaxID=5963 RepID=A0A1R2C0N3_9CILI|nr:hypothetical protein SteCoe_16697 [Stentor coeruleus]
MSLISMVLFLYLLTFASGILLEFYVVSDTTCWIVGPTSLGSYAIILSSNPGWSTKIPFAYWIWDIDGNLNSGNATITKNFYIAGAIKSGSLSIAADNYFTTYLNGEYANCKDTTGLTYKLNLGKNCDVTSYLVTGFNKLDVVVNNESYGPGSLMFKLTVLSNY